MPVIVTVVPPATGPKSGADRGDRRGRLDFGAELDLFARFRPLGATVAPSNGGGKMKPKLAPATSATPILSVALVGSTPIRSPAWTGRLAVKVCSPSPSGVTGLLVPAAMYPPEPLGRSTRREKGPPSASCIRQRTIAPLTGEVRFAPFSGSAVLKKVSTVRIRSAPIPAAARCQP